uniref:(+)RNA virus helicase C-terminal domain-containing protein n=1 Tax=Rhizoctonia solani putative virus 2 TaxID=2600108 RepID=A0A5B8H9F8_9VIRU|nr:hypothetical protein [Rhizoctonia solani putative virus 2]
MGKTGATVTRLEPLDARFFTTRLRKATRLPDLRGDVCYHIDISNSDLLTNPISLHIYDDDVDVRPAVPTDMIAKYRAVHSFVSGTFTRVKVCKECEKLNESGCNECTSFDVEGLMYRPRDVVLSVPVARPYSLKKGAAAALSEFLAYSRKETGSTYSKFLKRKSEWQGDERECKPNGLEALAKEYMDEYDAMHPAYPQALSRAAVAVTVLLKAPAAAGKSYAMLFNFTSGDCVIVPTAKLAAEIAKKAKEQGKDIAVLTYQKAMVAFLLGYRFRRVGLDEAFLFHQGAHVLATLMALECAVLTGDEDQINAVQRFDKVNLWKWNIRTLDYAVAREMRRNYRCLEEICKLAGYLSGKPQKAMRGKGGEIVFEREWPKHIKKPKRPSDVTHTITINQNGKPAHVRQDYQAVNTAHEFQGSESDVIWFIIDNETLGKKIGQTTSYIYVGITRARDKLYITCSPQMKGKIQAGMRASVAYTGPDVVDIGGRYPPVKFDDFEGSGTFQAPQASIYQSAEQHAHSRDFAEDGTPLPGRIPWKPASFGLCKDCQEVEEDEEDELRISKDGICEWHWSYRQDQIIEEFKNKHKKHVDLSLVLTRSSEEGSDACRSEALSTDVIRAQAATLPSAASSESEDEAVYMTAEREAHKPKRERISLLYDDYDMLDDFTFLPGGWVADGDDGVNTSDNCSLFDPSISAPSSRCFCPCCHKYVPCLILDLCCPTCYADSFTEAELSEDDVSAIKLPDPSPCRVRIDHALLTGCSACGYRALAPYPPTIECPVDFASDGPLDLFDRDAPVVKLNPVAPTMAPPTTEDETPDVSLPKALFLSKYPHLSGADYNRLRRQTQKAKGTYHSGGIRNKKPDQIKDGECFVLLVAPRHRAEVRARFKQWVPKADIMNCGFTINTKRSIRKVKKGMFHVCASDSEGDLTLADLDDDDNLGGKVAELSKTWAFIPLANRNAEGTFFEAADDGTVKWTHYGTHSWEPLWTVDGSRKLHKDDVIEWGARGHSILHTRVRAKATGRNENWISIAWEYNDFKSCENEEDHVILAEIDHKLKNEYRVGDKRSFSDVMTQFNKHLTTKRRAIESLNRVALWHGQPTFKRYPEVEPFMNTPGISNAPCRLNCLHKASDFPHEHCKKPTTRSGELSECEKNAQLIAPHVHCDIGHDDEDVDTAQQKACFTHIEPALEEHFPAWHTLDKHCAEHLENYGDFHSHLSDSFKSAADALVRSKMDIMDSRAPEFDDPVEINLLPARAKTGFEEIQYNVTHEKVPLKPEMSGTELIGHIMRGQFSSPSIMLVFNASPFSRRWTTEERNVDITSTMTKQERWQLDRTQPRPPSNEKLDLVEVTRSVAVLTVRSQKRAQKSPITLKEGRLYTADVVNNLVVQRFREGNRALKDKTQLSTVLEQVKALQSRVEQAENPHRAAKIAVRAFSHRQLSKMQFEEKVHEFEPRPGPPDASGNPTQIMPHSLRMACFMSVSDFHHKDTPHCNECTAVSRQETEAVVNNWHNKHGSRRTCPDPDAHTHICPGPVTVIKEVEKVVEIPVEVIKEVVKEVPVEVIKEVKVEVPVPCTLNHAPDVHECVKEREMELLEKENGPAGVVEHLRRIDTQDGQFFTHADFAHVSRCRAHITEKGRTFGMIQTTENTPSQLQGSILSTGWNPIWPTGENLQTQMVKLMTSLRENTLLEDATMETIARDLMAEVGIEGEKHTDSDLLASHTCPACIKPHGPICVDPGFHSHVCRPSVCVKPHGPICPMPGLDHNAHGPVCGQNAIDAKKKCPSPSAHSHKCTPCTREHEKHAPAELLVNHKCRECDKPHGPICTHKASDLVHNHKCKECKKPHGPICVHKPSDLESHKPEDLVVNHTCVTPAAVEARKTHSHSVRACVHHRHTDTDCRIKSYRLCPESHWTAAWKNDICQLCKVRREDASESLGCRMAEDLNARKVYSLEERNRALEDTAKASAKLRAAIVRPTFSKPNFLESLGGSGGKVRIGAQTFHCPKTRKLRVEDKGKIHADATKYKFEGMWSDWVLTPKGINAIYECQSREHKTEFVKNMRMTQFEFDQLFSAQAVAGEKEVHVVRYKTLQK